MDQNVVKVIITSAPSFHCIDVDYKETLAMTTNSIEYTCALISESNPNPAKHWKYQIDSRNFKAQYNLVASLATDALNSILNLLLPRKRTFKSILKKSR